MPDHRQHRGAHPEDRSLWSPNRLPFLQSAVQDMSWLLGHGYASKSVLKLVGDRYNLHARQREAVSRCSCSEQRRQARGSRQLSSEAVRGRPLLLDAFNVITTVEVALSGGVLLAGRDGCLRDVAGVHGTYREVEETVPAILLLGGFLQELQPSGCCWLLDQPVSNSGKLRGIVLHLSRQQGWGHTAELSPDPDKVLIRGSEVVVSSDSAVLDACGPWFNLVRAVVKAHVPDAWIIPLGSCGAG